MHRNIKQAQPSHSRVSNYKGVSWNRQHLKWESYVTEKGVRYDCGCYDDERSAAKGRDRKIIALGLNKPLQVLKPLTN